MAKAKMPKGPHPLTKAGEAKETRAMEKRESPAFERMERKLGLEKHGAGDKMPNHAKAKKAAEFLVKHEKESMGKGAGDGKNWIAGAIKKPGSLRASLGVPEGKNIPAKKLDKAAAAPGKLGQRARLAKTLKGMSRK